MNPIELAKNVIRNKKTEMSFVVGNGINQYIGV